MKSLSLRSPWGRAVLRWGKDVENRDWKALPKNAPRQVLLHSSLWFDDEEIAMLARSLADDGLVPEEGPITLRQFRDQLGGIIGRVNIVGVQRNGAPGSKASRWAEEGMVGLLLAEPVEAPTFVPWPGELGFFEVDSGAYRDALAFAKEHPGAARADYHRFWPERLRPPPKAAKGERKAKASEQADLFAGRTA